jgi:glycosyltransferase involved in cell wall biosynthesis
VSTAPHLLILSGTAQTAHNGSSRVERALATELSQLGVEVTLLTRDTEPLRDVPFAHELYRRPSTKVWKQWLLAGRVAQRIAEIHARHPIALLHAFGFFPVCEYAMRFSASSGVPYLLTQHSMDVAGAPKKALERAARITCLSEAQRRAVTALGVEASRFELIPNGVDAAPAEEPVPEGIALPSEAFVLFAGRLEPEKGIFLLLDALESLPAQQRPRLVIAGDGRDRERVAARARDLGASLLPWLPHGSLMSILRRADALALPSLSEGAPLLPLEAFQRSVPVIAHDLPAFELSRDQIEAISIGDARAWSNALARVREGAHRDAARIERARSFAQSLSWRGVAIRYLELYRRVGLASTVSSVGS